MVFPQQANAVMIATCCCSPMAPGWTPAGRQPRVMQLLLWRLLSAASPMSQLWKPALSPPWGTLPLPCASSQLPSHGPPLSHHSRQRCLPCPAGSSAAMAHLVRPPTLVGNVAGQHCWAPCTQQAQLSPCLVLCVAYLTVNSLQRLGRGIYNGPPMCKVALVTRLPEAGRGLLWLPAMLLRIMQMAAVSGRGCLNCKLLMNLAPHLEQTAAVVPSKVLTTSVAGEASHTFSAYQLPAGV